MNPAGLSGRTRYILKDLLQPNERASGRPGSRLAGPPLVAGRSTISEILRTLGLTFGLIS